MRLIILVAVVLVAVVAAGCGSGGAGGTPVPMSDFPARYAAGWCGLTQRCCQASGGTSTGSCAADITAQVTSIGVEASADGATWDATAAGRCLDAIRTADCAGTDVAALVALLDVCSDTWTGVVPPGGACMTYASCMELPVSGGASAGASCVNSTCVPIVRQPTGATCDNTTFVCNPLESSCATGICVALPGPGQACTGDCRAGSRCTNALCAPLLEMGATCAANGDCVSDKCSGGRCASAVATDDYCMLP